MLGQRIGGLRRLLGRAQARGVRVMRRTPLAGRNTIILRYTAPRSGRAIESPVWGVRHDEGWIVAVTADAKTWWKAFRRPVRTQIERGEETADFVGRLVVEEARRAELLETYFTRIPSTRRTMGASPPLIEFVPAASSAI